MIQWLSEWLKEIILIILLATFVDLILPNSSMQRYVKVVISLFILLVILSPILSLLDSDIDLRNMSSFEINGNSSVDLNRMKTIEEIRSEGDKLKSNNALQSLQFMDLQIAEMMKKQLEEEIPDYTYDVAVKTKVNEQTNTPEISRVQIILVPMKEQNDQKAKEQKLEDHVVVDVKPIEPISIQIDLGKDHAEAVNAFEHAENKKDTDGEKTRLKILKYLKENWRITSNQLTIIYSLEAAN